MIVTCGKCKTKYRVNDSSIRQKEFRARCLRCDHAFLVRKPETKSKNTRQNERALLGDPDGTKHSTPAEANCKVIAVCNRKGGVAKTTTCINLAAALSKMKKRVLLVDFDIQANLSLLLGCQNEKSFFDVIHSHDTELSQYIVKTKANFWLLPSNSKMALLSKKHLPKENFEYMLRDKIMTIRSYFDFILIDTPPSGDFYTLNALLASDEAIIPTQCEYLSMSGVSHIVNMIDVIEEKAGHKIDYHVLITLFENDNTVGNVVRSKINKEYEGKIFDTLVYKDRSVQESQIFNQAVVHYREDSDASKQYFELAKEILQIQGKSNVKNVDEEEVVSVKYQA